jgi:hypothetical protein
MKEEILKRAMFAMPLSKDARNSGIMSGFDMDEMDEMPEPSEASEDMPQMSRSPQNPEILMNNLRGDVRSVDARYQELAQMVGEEVAMETPPEVLAMLQNQFSQQQGGIGGLPQAQGMAPAGAPGAAPGGAPAGMPPGGGAAPQQPPQGIEAAMPQGMASAPPFSQGGASNAPQQFADGGAVSGGGMLNLQVPINIGGNSGPGGMGMGGGMGGTALQQGYGGNIAPPMQQQSSTMGMVANMGQGGGQGLPPGIDPRAVAANPQAYQQWLQQAQAQERAMPGSTMFGQSQNMSVAQSNAPQQMKTGPRSPFYYAEGGAVEPMTHDGMPPMHAQFGAFATPFTRAAQYLGDKIGPMATEANVIGGRLMSQGFPQTFRPVFENLRGPGGRFTAEQVLKYPTLTEHLSNLAGPQVTGMVERAGNLVAPAAATAAGMVGASGLYKSMFGGEKQDPERKELLDTYERLYYSQPGMDKSIPMPSLTNRTNEQLLTDVTAMANRAPEKPAPAAPAAGPSKPAGANLPTPESQDTLGDFIQQKLTEQQARDAAAGTTAKPNVAAPTMEPTKSRFERIKEAKAEYAPLYKELLGDTKDDMYTNAMLMLADAGFKYAQLPASAGTTPASLLATAVSGIPQGFMALLSQARENKLKVDTAALSQAVTDVQEQDKYAQQLKLKLLDLDKATMVEMIKQGGGTIEDGGAGMLISKTKGGGYKGVSIDPNNPTVQTAVSSPWTLRPTDNPFVENRGQAPTAVETDKEQRIKLTSSLRGLDDALSKLDGLRGQYSQLYSPGTWFTDKVNNLLVPVTGGLIRPDLDQAASATKIQIGLNDIVKRLAAANDQGRVAVQEQEWARDMLNGLTEPNKFFANKELAAKQFVTMEAELRNARQRLLTQLGYEKDNYVMNTPNTGTQNDPFVISSDPDQQRRMYNFLGSTIGKTQDPRATVYLRMPNGSIQSATPPQLRGLMQ